MTTYEFSFILSGFDVNDEAHMEGLHTGCNGFEAYASTDGERTLITFVVDALTDGAALVEAHEALMDGPCVSGAQVLGVDRDLVTISEIAERVDRGRESVRLMVTGARRDGNFPHHIGVVGRGMRVWYWADVYPWLRERDLVDDDLVPVSVQTAKAFEHGLSIRRASGRLWASRGAQFHGGSDWARIEVRAVRAEPQLSRDWSGYRAPDLHVIDG